MSLFQRLTNWLLGWEYVVLHHSDGDNHLRRAYQLGEYIYATPYSEYTRTILLPNGKVDGQPYVIYWIPVTQKVTELYNSQPEVALKDAGVEI